MENTPVIAAKDVTRCFKAGGDTVTALGGISLEAEEGTLVCLRGRSGSGKTTLINILGALDRPTDGNVYFSGEDIGAFSEGRRDRLRRYEMAFVFQSVALISAMTAYENVELALRLAGAPIRERSARAKECLRLVGLEKRMHHRPGELSGGEQQRVAVARAIAHRPRVIFADEPTAELDSQTGLAVVKLFREIIASSGSSKIASSKENTPLTIIMTTHDEAVMELADVVYHLEDGVIASVSRPAEESEKFTKESTTFTEKTMKFTKESTTFTEKTDTFTKEGENNAG